MTTVTALVVWPVLTHHGHGEGTMLLGVYATREDAFRAIKAEPDMTAYVDDNGHVCGRPKREGARGRWAHGRAATVQATEPGRTT